MSDLCVLKSNMYSIFFCNGMEESDNWFSICTCIK